MNLKLITVCFSFLVLGACSKDGIDLPAKYVFDKASIKSQSVYAFQNGISKEVNPTTGEFAEINRLVIDSFDILFEQLTTMFPFTFQSIELLDEKTAKVIGLSGADFTVPYEKLSEDLIIIDGTTELKIGDNTLAQCFVLSNRVGVFANGMEFSIPDLTFCSHSATNQELAKKVYDEYTKNGTKVDSVMVTPFNVFYRRK